MESDSNSNIVSGAYTRKLALNTASLSTLYALPLVSQAGIVHVTTPLNMSIEDARAFDYQPIDWDVDGNSVADFRLEAFRTISYSGGGSGSYYSYGLSRPFGRLELNDSSGGRGMVQNTGDGSSTVRPLAAGDVVGATLDAGRQWGPSVNRILMTSSSYSGFLSNGLSDGSNLIGFSFDDSGQTRYGWAEVFMDESLLEMSVVQWAYDDSGNSIEVGQVSAVPLPPAFLTMLSGLALGAGGVLRGRKVRDARKAKESADA